MHRITREILDQEKFNNSQILIREDAKRYLPSSSYWKEVAGVFKLYPRQSGKTTALKELCELKRNAGEKVIYGVPFGTAMFKEQPGDLNFATQSVTPNWMRGLDYNQYHLVLDEFTFFPSECLEELLRHDWKSVTALGTLK